MKHVQFLFLFVLLFGMTQAQSKKDTLSNTTIVSLHTAGLGSDIIKSKIQISVCVFDLSTDALIALKKAGIPDEVVSAMISKNGATATDNAQSDTTKILPGIYYCHGNPCALTELEASVYSQVKTGSGMLTALTYGVAKTKMKSTLSGSLANLQIEEKNPVFYFYFDPGNSNNFGGNASAFWFTTATSPNEFLLVKFTMTKKTREVVTGSWNSYAGVSSGIDDKNKIPFKYEKISRGVYKVYSEKPLKSAEYCFMYAGSTSYGGAPLQKVYDFGIK